MARCNACHITLWPAHAEICWYCTGDLCGDCWDYYGHCGHAEAEAFNRTLRAGGGPHLRRPAAPDSTPAASGSTDAVSEAH